MNHFILVIYEQIKPHCHYQAFKVRVEDDKAVFGLHPLLRSGGGFISFNCQRKTENMMTLIQLIQSFSSNTDELFKMPLTSLFTII